MKEKKSYRPYCTRKVSIAAFLLPRRLCNIDKGVSRAEDCNPCYCRHRTLPVRLRLLFSVLCRSHRPKGDYLELLFILIQPFAVDWQRTHHCTVCILRKRIKKKKAGTIFHHHKFRNIEHGSLEK